MMTAARHSRSAVPLIALLDDPVEEVRAAAAYALSHLALPPALAEQVREALSRHQSDPSQSVRQAISAALSRLEYAGLSAPIAEADHEHEYETAAEELADDEPTAWRSPPRSEPSEKSDAAADAAPPDAPSVTALPAIEIPVLPMSPFHPPHGTPAGPPPPAPSTSTGSPPPPAPPQESDAPITPITPIMPVTPTEQSLRERHALEQEAQEVQFSAYFPREIASGRWYPLTAYLFRSFAAEQVLADARSTLGAWLATVRRVLSNVRRTLPEGTIVTATPYMEGVQFNPPAITLGFYESWHRLDFRMRANDASPYHSANGRLTFTVEGVIVADIPLSVYIMDAGSTDSAGSMPSTTSTSNPTSGDAMQTVSQKLYKSIFCSYSREDKAIVERVERVYKALGFDFLRDVVSLKSGEDWNDKLYALIEQADIFQLFWSKTAAESEFVEREWRHALSLKRDDRNFIRPVYWEEPMPPVPDELDSIHFAYEPTLDDNL